MKKAKIILKILQVVLSVACTIETYYNPAASKPL